MSVECKKNNILLTIQLFSLDLSCWHKIIENECGNPCSLQIKDYNVPKLCNGFCPRCDGTMNETIKLINRIGIKHFVVDSFWDKYNGLVTPIKLAKKLFEFENVGDAAHRCKNIRRLN